MLLSCCSLLLVLCAIKINLKSPRQGCFYLVLQPLIQVRVLAWPLTKVTWASHLTSRNLVLSAVTQNNAH